MPATKRSRTLTIFLLKHGVSEDGAIDEEVANDLKPYSVMLDGKPAGILHARQTPLDTVSWAGLFAEATRGVAALKNTSVSAIYLTRTSGRVFALSFGHGRHLLREGVFEERFGLRVTLNSVDPNELRAVEVTTLEASPFHARRQASRATTLGQFGLNLDQDILRAVTGKPTDERLGTSMTGIDSLSVRVKADLSDIKSLLKRYLEKSEEGTYRQHFHWVDHVAEVRDGTLNEDLFARLLNVLAKKHPGNVWAAIPEVIDWTTFDSFRFGSPVANESADDITLDRMLSAIEGETISINLLRKKRVFCVVEGTSHPKHAWSYLKCLAAELPVKGDLYVLNAGTWFRVSSDYVSDIDREVNSLEATAGALPVWGDELEDEYNQRVARQSSGKLALMDRVMISHPGMASPIEFCDLYSDDRRLMHVKRYGQSSILSHLFMQGLVSANSLLADSVFRHAVNAKLPASHRIADPDTRPLPQLFEVAFVIGSTETGRLNLPFFSRVTLKNVAQTLSQSLGLRVTLSKVRIDKLAYVRATRGD